MNVHQNVKCSYAIMYDWYIINSPLSIVKAVQNCSGGAVLKVAFLKLPTIFVSCNYYKTSFY